MPWSTQNTTKQQLLLIYIYKELEYDFNNKKNNNINENINNADFEKQLEEAKKRGLKKEKELEQSIEKTNLDKEEYHIQKVLNQLSIKNR